MNRYRNTDPLASVVGAEKSESNLHLVRLAVVALLREQGPLDGRELNARYRAWARVNYYPACAYDSPRKRAGELVKKGVLRVVNADEYNGRGTPAIYGVKDD